MQVPSNCARLGALALLVVVTALLVLLFSGQPAGRPRPQWPLQLACDPGQRPREQAAPAVRWTPDPQHPLPTPRLAGLEAVSHTAELSPPALVLQPRRELGAVPAATGGNHLAVALRDAEGWSCIYVVDLDSGQARQIATLRGAAQALAVSQRYAAWLDAIYPPDCARDPQAPPCSQPAKPFREELHVYDLQDASERTFRANYDDTIVSLSDTALARQGLPRRYVVDIHDLRSGFVVTVTVPYGLGGLGLGVLAGDYLAYSPAPPSYNAASADLHVLNWRTGGDLVLGQVPYAGPGTFVADGTRLLWVERRGLPDTRHRGTETYTLQLADLALHENRALPVSDKLPLQAIGLSGDIAVFSRYGPDMHSSIRMLDLASGQAVPLLPFVAETHVLGQHVVLLRGPTGQWTWDIYLAELKQ